MKGRLLMWGYITVQLLELRLRAPLLAALASRGSLAVRCFIFGGVTGLATGCGGVRPTSERLDIKSGVRQGDPLAFLLFNAVIETLALLIKDSPRLPGFVDETGRRHIVDMYADDTIVLLTTLRQGRELRRIYDVYAKASGSALNVAKTAIVNAGDQRRGNSMVRGIEVVSAGTYLGAPVGPGADLTAFSTYSALR